MESIIFQMSPFMSSEQPEDACTVSVTSTTNPPEDEVYWQTLCPWFPIPASSYLKHIMI